MQEYINTDQKLHVISQLIAKANRSFIPKKDDDSHTNLYFDHLGKRIAGRWIKTSSSRVLFSFNLELFQFEWIDGSYKKIDSISLKNHALKEIEDHSEEVFKSLGLNTGGLKADLHYEIPSYSFSDKELSSINENDIHNWIEYRELVNNSCHSILGYLNATSEVRIWPHHFDTGIYAPTDLDIGIGFGLAMKDSLSDSPYFYLSGYAAEGKINFSKLPELSHGKWQVGEHFKGAVYPLNSKDSLSAIKENLDRFIKEALNKYVN
jgi:hypothetical protein